MPSPFPGMDPYLEAPRLWPGFHGKLASEITTELNNTLPSPYYADIDVRPEIGIAEEGRTPRRIVPDVAVISHPHRRPVAGGAAVLERPRRDVSDSIEMVVHVEMFRHHFVEIRDPTQGHKLITVIEILSPSNKRSGPDRDAYEAKRQSILESDANLIELDLLRRGERIVPDIRLDPPADYVVLVNRAWRRGEGIAYQVFPITLREWLPCISIPLKEREAEVPLDLQFVFNRVYDGGPYRRGAVDYTQPPDPPLSGDDAEWAERLLREGGQAGPEA